MRMQKNASDWEIFDSKKEKGYQVSGVSFLYKFEIESETETESETKTRVTGTVGIMPGTYYVREIKASPGYYRRGGDFGENLKITVGESDQFCSWNFHNAQIEIFPDLWYSYIWGFAPKIHTESQGAKLWRRWVDCKKSMVRETETDGAWL